MESLKWSLAEYYIISTLYIFNAVLFSVYLVKIIRSKEDFKYVKSNIWTIISLLCIISGSILQPFGLLRLITPLSSDQTVKCKALGIYRDIIFRFGVFSRCFMIFKVLQLNVEPYPPFMLRYPKKLTTWMKCLLILGFISANILSIGVFQVTYQIHPINTDSNARYVCIYAIDDQPWARRAIFGVYGLMIIAMHFLFCYLMIAQTKHIYESTKERLIVQDYIKTKKNINLILHALIIPGIRLSILVVIMAMITCIWTLIQIAGITNSAADPLANFVLASCVIMILPVGKSWFNILFQRIEKRIVTKWIHFEIGSLNVSTRKGSTEVNEVLPTVPNSINPKSVSIQMSDANLTSPSTKSRIVKKELNAIRENVEDEIGSMRLSKLSSFSPIVTPELASQTGTFVCSGSRNESTVSDSSGTASMILEARMGLEVTRSSITSS